MSLENLHKNQLIKYALYSRLLVIFLGFVSNILIPDHNTDAFKAPQDPEAYKSIIYRVTKYAFGGFIRWDAQYFQHIARHGYTYESSLAFFPLFPMIARGISLSLDYVYSTNLDAVITLTFMVLNVFFFILALIGLYDLTKMAFNERFAYIAGCLFVINPATIFFVAPYTESLYAYLTFRTIYHCTFVSGGSHWIRAIFYITLSVLTRSNGLLNIGFLAFFLIQGVVCKYTSSTKNNAKVTQMNFSLGFFISCGFSMIIPVLFFLSVQYYHYHNFCKDFPNNFPDYVTLFARKHSITMAGEFSKHNPPWCHNAIPLSYKYVQRKYWEVGFLRYYKFKQIPNFLLAVPVLFIILKNIGPYLIKNIGSILNLEIFKINKDAQYKGVKCRNDIVIVCFVHASFLAIFCIFFVHIQVSTRMILSASPAFYWICAYYFTGLTIKKQPFFNSFLIHLTKEQLFLLTYFFSYIIVGTVMFCNYLPWT